MNVEYGKNWIDIKSNGFDPNKEIELLYLERFIDATVEPLTDTFGNIYGIRLKKTKKESEEE